jgi:hypothetical protein
MLRFRAFASLVGDPAPFVRKELRVQYEIGGRRGTIVAKDGESIRLPELTGTLDAELLGVNQRLTLRAWKPRSSLPAMERRSITFTSALCIRQRRRTSR